MTLYLSQSPEFISFYHLSTHIKPTSFACTPRFLRQIYFLCDEAFYLCTWPSGWLFLQFAIITRLVSNYNEPSGSSTEREQQRPPFSAHIATPAKFHYRGLQSRLGPGWRVLHWISHGKRTNLMLWVHFLLNHSLRSFSKQINYSF